MLSENPEVKIREKLRKLGLHYIGDWPNYVVEICPLIFDFKKFPEIKLIKCYSVDDIATEPRFYFARSDQLGKAEEFLRYSLGFEQVIIDPEENE